MLVNRPVVEISAAVMTEEPTCNFAPGLVVPMPTLPFCLMTKRFSPEEEAVKISPTPELSTTRAAIEVAPEIEAPGMGPRTERTSRVARGEGGLMPILPVLATLIASVMIPDLFVARDR